MRKRLLSIMLSLAMMLTMVPMLGSVAFAASQDELPGMIRLCGASDNYALIEDNTYNEYPYRLRSNNFATRYLELGDVVYLVVDSSGNITDVNAGANNYNIKYDISAAELTLKDATLHYINAYNHNSGKGTDNFTIKLLGKNKIIGDHSHLGTGYYWFYGIRTVETGRDIANLTFTGDGELTITMPKARSGEGYTNETVSTGIRAKSKIIIDGPSVIISGGQVAATEEASKVSTYAIKVSDETNGCIDVKAGCLQTSMGSIADDNAGSNITCENIAAPVYATDDHMGVSDGNIFNFDGSANAKDAVQFDVQPIKLSTKSYTYNGKAKKPSVTLPYFNSENIHVTYPSDCKNAGTKQLTFTIDGYSGDAKANYVIKKATPSVKITSSSKTVKYSKVRKKATYTSAVSVSGAKGTKTFTKTGGSKKLTISKTSGKIKVAKGTKKGTYSIKVKVKSASTSNYNAKTSSVKTIKVKVK